MNITLTPQQALRILAGLTIFSGLILLGIEREVDSTAKKARFLIDIIERNLDQLEEFDLIAMRELGLIDPS